MSFVKTLERLEALPDKRLGSGHYTGVHGLDAQVPWCAIGCASLKAQEPNPQSAHICAELGLSITEFYAVLRYNDALPYGVGRSPERYRDVVAWLRARVEEASVRCG